jgi:hypothetical protein
VDDFDNLTETPVTDDEHERQTDPRKRPTLDSLIQDMIQETKAAVDEIEDELHALGILREKKSNK